VPWNGYAYWWFYIQELGPSVEPPPKHFLGIKIFELLKTLTIIGNYTLLKQKKEIQ